MEDGHDYKVPVVAKEKRAYYLPTPPSNPSQPKRRAVVLDCEMVGYVQQHDPEVPVKIQNPKEKSEVIRVSAVDMLTGEVLINSFVAPPDKHQGNIHWRTSFTGVTAAVMEEKQAAGELIASWKDVRAQLWKYIDSSTILVGHALHHDLEALRMVHTQVVDTQILADEMMQANDGVIRQWSLKRMCESLLRETIQKDGAPHSPLEDAYATRKLAIKLLSGGDVVADWMQRQRLAIDARRAAAAKAKQARKDEPRVLYSGYMSVGRPN
ncbi:hypothetical protein KEM52_005504 [Ascosphaera acerosa]|nr:hypothetical protein KEM52_005504 [Ascosphaera acerosa]